MPSISKQRVGTKPSSNGKQESSVLSRISPLRASKIGRIKASIYGVPKTGKTRIACTFPKPLLILGFEDGSASVVGSEGVEFVKMQTCAELGELVDGPISEGRWATIVLDNGTKMRDMRIAEIKGLDRAPAQKSFGFATREQWMECSASLKDMLAQLLDMPNRMDLNVVVIAQEQTLGGEDSDHISDVIKPAVGSALGKSLCMWLNAECDYVMQTFIREGTREKVIKLPSGKEQHSIVKTGKKEYCLRVGPHETFITGFRVPLGLPDPPDAIVNPSYEKIVKVIRGEKP